MRLVILMGLCVALAALWVTNYFGRTIPVSLAGQWVVDAVDGKPLAGERRPIVVLRGDGSVQVDLAGHDELADDLDRSWLQEHLVGPSDPKTLGPGKVTGIQIPRKSNPDGRIALRKID